MIGDFTEAGSDDEAEDEQNNRLISDQHTLTLTDQKKFQLAPKSQIALQNKKKNAI